MAIFNSYVKLPEGKRQLNSTRFGGKMLPNKQRIQRIEEFWAQERSRWGRLDSADVGCSTSILGHGTPRASQVIKTCHMTMLAICVCLEVDGTPLHPLGNHHSPYQTWHLRSWWPLSKSWRAQGHWYIKSHVWHEIYSFLIVKSRLLMVQSTGFFIVFFFS